MGVDLKRDGHPRPGGSQAAGLTGRNGSYMSIQQVMRGILRALTATSSPP